jgi:hypothetical protein
MKTCLKLFIFIVIHLAILFTAAVLPSCKKMEAKTIPVAVSIPEGEKSFIEKLSVRNSGKTIFFKKESDRIAGASGNVKYSITQREHQAGTNMVTIDFHITSGSSAAAQILNYTLAVDMVSLGISITDAGLNGTKLSEDNLMSALERL